MASPNKWKEGAEDSKSDSERETWGCYRAGFEDAGGHEPRSAGGL